MNKLAFKDILALGFLIFAFFVGAGNIIFPPIIGLQAGNNVWHAALGFVITAVGLPVITIFAMSRVQGMMDHLSQPIGKTASVVLAVVCYLMVGPMFATPRTATVSYEVGFMPYLGDSKLYLCLYSIVYFIITAVVSFYPGKILDSIGKFLAPIKILALIVLGVTACLFPAGNYGPVASAYQTIPVAEGVVNGYLTMDTLAGLIFGIVIVNAVRSRKIEDSRLIARYTMIAALIAGTGLLLVYLSLFKLGANSYAIAPGATNGAEVLHAYVQFTFGSLGSLFLGFLITLACLVTAIGLTTACAEYFSDLTGWSYKYWVILLAGSSLVIANLGLTKLIQVSVPVLTAIYPLCIVLVLLSFFHRCWRFAPRVVIPVALISLIFGIFDGLKVAGLDHLIPHWLTVIPLQNLGMAWAIPSVVVLVVMMVTDRCVPVPNQKKNSHHEK